MEVTSLDLQKAMTLELSMEMVHIKYDLYRCLSAVLLNKIPADVTDEERDEAKKALYMYAYSN